MKNSIILLILLCSSAAGESAGEVTFEWRFLRLVALESDPVKQIEALNAFVRKFPGSPGMRAVYAQLQDQYNRAQRWPESLQAGAMLLATNDRDVEAVRRTLTAARGLNDAVLVQKWDDRLTELTTESERARTVDAGVGTTAAQINPEHVKAEREAAAFNQAAQERRSPPTPEACYSNL